MALFSRVWVEGMSTFRFQPRDRPNRWGRRVQDDTGWLTGWDTTVSFGKENWKRERSCGFVVAQLLRDAMRWKQKGTRYRMKGSIWDTQHPYQTECRNGCECVPVWMGGPWGDGRGVRGGRRAVDGWEVLFSAEARSSRSHRAASCRNHHGLLTMIRMATYRVLGGEGAEFITRSSGIAHSFIKIQMFCSFVCDARREGRQARRSHAGSE